MFKDDFDECRSIIKELEGVLNSEYKNGQTVLDHYLFLSSVIENQENKVAMAKATDREILFKEMMRSKIVGFDLKPKDIPRAKDSDYCLAGIDVSLKSVGYSSPSPQFALAWSKNKPGGIKRFFESHMMIVSFKKPCGKKSKKWLNLEQGFYIVPLGTLKKIVNRFGSNNKTDTLITSDHVENLVRWAYDNGFHIPFKYDHSAGEKYYLPVWDAKPKLKPGFRKKNVKNSKDHQLSLFPDSVVAAII